MLEESDFDKIRAKVREEAEQRGFERGFEDSFVEAFEQGFTKSVEQGMISVIERALKVGVKCTNERVARDMLKKKFPLKLIKTISKLSEKAIRTLADKFGLKVVEESAD